MPIAAWRSKPRCGLQGRSSESNIRKRSDSTGGRRAPVLSERLRIFDSDERPCSPHRGFERQAAIGIDGESGTPYEGSRVAAVRCESKWIASRMRHRFSRVTADKRPLLHLPL